MAVATGPRTRDRRFRYRRRDRWRDHSGPFAAHIHRDGARASRWNIPCPRRGQQLWWYGRVPQAGVGRSAQRGDVRRGGHSRLVGGAVCRGGRFGRGIQGAVCVYPAGSRTQDDSASRSHDGIGTKSKPLIPALATSRRVTTTAGEVYTYDFNEGLATGFNVLLGFVSAFFGTGGGFMRTPVLVAAFNFPVRVAVATSVFALSIYATIGAGVHAYLGHVDWYPTFLWAGLGLLAGSQIGARLGATVETRWLMRVLVGLLLVMGIRLLIEGAVG